MSNKCVISAKLLLGDISDISKPENHFVKLGFFQEIFFPRRYGFIGEPFN